MSGTTQELLRNQSPVSNTVGNLNSLIPRQNIANRPPCFCWRPNSQMPWHTNKSTLFTELRKFDPLGSQTTVDVASFNLARSQRINPNADIDVVHGLLPSSTLGAWIWSSSPMTLESWNYPMPSFRTPELTFDVVVGNFRYLTPNSQQIAWTLPYAPITLVILSK